MVSVSVFLVFTDFFFNVNRVLLLFENVVMREKDKNEKKLELIAYLDGEAIQFSFENFAKDGTFTEKSKNCEKVRKVFVERFKNKLYPENLMRETMEAMLD